MRTPRSLSASSLLGRLAQTGLLGLLALGCQNRGDVSGTVAYQNRPLTYGTVLFVASDGNLHQGPIEEDGSYVVRGVLVGRARVAVNSPDAATPLVSRDEERREADEREMRRRTALRGRWFPIPDKYGDPDKSQLTLEVQKGANQHDIRLK